MKYLLDTHALIWFVEGNNDLSKKARAIIEDVQNEKFISIASLWEITIKLTKKKPGFEVSLGELYYFLEVNKIEILPVDFRHLNTLLQLPRHHNDPFDRMVIAQSVTENLALVSTDGAFPAYGLQLIW